MAEAIFLHYVREAGLADRFAIDSAGTSGYHAGEEYHRETHATCARHGIPIRGKSRPVVVEDFTNFDYILAMDSSNHADLSALCASASLRAKITHMLEHCEADFIPGLDVPDPYYGGRDGFERVFELLADSCRGLLNKICAKHGLEPK